MEFFVDLFAPFTETSSTILLASHLLSLFILLHYIKECLDFIMFALIFRYSTRILILHLFFCWMSKVLCQE
jgi:hypothetical protein